jgi:glycosyltransferase involved in cell wall biosynthesis
VKIGLVTRFFNLRNGGIGRFSTEMLTGLKKRGCEVVPVSTEHNSTLGNVIFSSVELAFRWPRGCDVYHCLTPLQAMHAPKESTVVTFHDLIPWLHLEETDTHYAQGRMKAVKSIGIRYYSKTTAKIASRCRHIVCNSEETRREVIERLGADESKVSVVRFGINPKLEPNPKPDGPFRFGTLSYLDPRKRIDLLIREFLAADIDGELVIGGSGAEYFNLKKLAGQDNRIKFLGFVPEDRLAEFYNSLDLFVFPSKIEGYGLPIVEAFACKKPVVVLRDAVLPQEVKSRCTVVDTLKDFIENPRISGDAEANYTFAKAHDWDNCVAEYLKIFERVLA